MTKLNGQLDMFDDSTAFREEADEVTKFSPEAAETAKEAGMFAATLSRGQILVAAQELAVQLAKRNPLGVVTMDDVHAILIQWGHRPEELGPAAGSVFKGSLWICVGMIPSARVSNHGRLLRQWKLREPGEQPSQWIPVGRKSRGDQ